MDAIFKMLKAGYGDLASPLLRHMSIPARNILTECVRVLLAATPPAGGKETVTKFLHGWEPFTYELTALSYDVFQLCKAIPHIPRNIRDPDLLLGYVTLARLDLLEEQHPKKVVHRQGAPSELPAHFRMVYRELTDGFVLDDFHGGDLSKLQSMCQEYSSRDILDTANSIKDLDKRSISYLYSIVRHNIAVGKAKSARVDSIEDQSADKLAVLVKLFESAKSISTPAPAYDPEWARHLDIEVALDEEAERVQNQKSRQDTNLAEGSGGSSEETDTET